MKGAHKKFSPNLYNRYDAPAKEVVIYNFKKNNPGADVYENPDRYGPDLIVTRDGEPTGFIEVEVKLHYGNHDQFPYPDVNVLERKKKFFDAGCELWLLNLTLNRALVIRKESITEDRLVEVPNKYKPSGELFYKVPIAEATLVRMETLF